MPHSAGATRPTKTRCLEAAESPARMHRETDVPMRIVPSIRRQRLARPRTAGVETQPRGDDAAVSRSALLRKVARRRSAASSRTVIGSRQLVAGNPFPPLASLLYSIPGLAGGGFSFHEAAGSRSLRRFIIRPAEVLLSAGDGRWRFSRSARAGCVRADRGECEVIA